MTKLKKSIHTKLLALVLACGFVMSFTSIANAQSLSQPKEFYDSISWSWYYSDKATPAYNCLGFATGSMTWEWPRVWGDGATKAQVDSYLATKGYRPYIYDPFILAYGPSVNHITHFAKVTGLEWCRAKWGQLELFNHGSHDPYYHDSLYGALQIKYTAN